MSKLSNLQIYHRFPVECPALEYQGDRLYSFFPVYVSRHTSFSVTRNFLLCLSVSISLFLSVSVFVSVSVFLFLSVSVHLSLSLSLCVYVTEDYEGGRDDMLTIYLFIIIIITTTTTTTIVVLVSLLFQLSFPWRQVCDSVSYDWDWQLVCDTQAIDICCGLTYSNQAATGRRAGAPRGGLFAGPSVGVYWTDGARGLCQGVPTTRTGSAP